MTPDNHLDVKPPTTRLAIAITLFLVAIACPIVGTIVLASDLAPSWKVAAGFLYFPIPEIFDLTAIAIIGRPGFAWLKSKLLGVLRRHGPPAEVSARRYRLGLVMFLLPLAFGWLHPYFFERVPVLVAHRVAFNLAGDLVFVSSFFVLGGNFWDKLRALFIHRATVHLPIAEPGNGAQTT